MVNGGEYSIKPDLNVCMSYEANNTSYISTIKQRCGEEKEMRLIQTCHIKELLNTMVITALHQYNELESRFDKNEMSLDLTHQSTD